MRRESIVVIAILIAIVCAALIAALATPALLGEPSTNTGEFIYRIEW